eukprot:3616214-Lingulodinium_polyedra.AAC.1
MHRSSPFAGEPPFGAYDPTVPEGAEMALPGTYARAGSIHDLHQRSFRLRERRNEVRNAKERALARGRPNNGARGRTTVQ